MKFINHKYTKSVKIQRYSSSNQPVELNYVSSDVSKEFKGSTDDQQILMTQVIEGEGCHIAGYILIEKAPGSIHFFIDEKKYGALRQGLGDRKIPEISFTHNVNLVTFGNYEDQQQMIKIFGRNEVTDFNRADYIPPQSDVNFCLYYFPLVPHMFSVGKEAIDKETYQYSIVYNCQETPMKSASYQITFAYHLNPVGIYYNKEEFTLLQVFTTITAIITGVYVIMGIIKQTIDNLT